MFNNYLGTRSLSPFPPADKSNWCEICRIWGHSPPNFLVFRGYQISTRAPFYDLCNSVGIDVNKFHALELMEDNTIDTYRVQGTEENKASYKGG